MASFEKHVIAAILKMIRARREAPPVWASDVASRAGIAVAPARIREAQFSDFNAVAELKQRWGLAADSCENWERLWHRNPALAQSEVERPIGWVLEAEGRVVGYLGNISLLYDYCGKTLTAVTAHGLVVEPPYRAVTLSLLAAFFRQKDVDLYIGSSAIESVGKMARAFKADPVPQADCDTALFWVLKPYCFARSMMDKLKLAPTASQIGRIVASLAVVTDKTLRMRWPKRTSTSVTVSEISIDEIGNEFRTLWAAKLNEGHRLRANRSPAALRWHFAIPGDRGSVRVLCCRRNSELLGYAVIRDDAEANGLRKSIVADILARQDDPEVLKALLIAAYDYAKHGGSYMLELLGFPLSIRQICLQWNPYTRKYPASPFHYKAADPMLHKTLSSGQEWYASPFDGDATLIRPSYSNCASRFNDLAAQTEVVGNPIALDVSEAKGTEVVRP